MAYAPLVEVGEETVISQHGDPKYLSVPELSIGVKKAYYPVASHKPQGVYQDLGVSACTEAYHLQRFTSTLGSTCVLENLSLVGVSFVHVRTRTAVVETFQ